MSYASVCCATPEYQSALKKNGFTVASTVEYNGKTYTHDDIADSFDRAYQKYRGEYPMVCGANPLQERRYVRHFERAVKSDVYGDFGISFWTLVSGAFLTFLGGPLGLVIAVVTVLFQHYLQKDLDGDKEFAAVMGAS